MSTTHTILLIETATSACSVAVCENGKILAEAGRNESNIHAGALTGFIAEALQAAGRDFQSLAAVAVSAGPGSYTGLRIGVSTAKGLCYALDIPLLSVSTLRAMAQGILNSGQTIQGELLLPMIDARRMEVYTAIFDQNLHTIEDVHAKIVDANSFEHYQDRRLLLFGDGALKFSDTFQEHDHIRILAYENGAAALALEAQSKFEKGEFENTAYFEPFYLKDFVATTPRATS